VAAGDIANPDTIRGTPAPAQGRVLRQRLFQWLGGICRRDHKWPTCQLGDKSSAAFIALVLTLFIALIPGPGFRQELVSRRISEYRCAGKGADRSDSSNPRGQEKSRL
jgi:hypothetical protein